MDVTDAEQMIDQCGAGRLLAVCERGGVGARAAVREVLLRLSQLAQANLDLATVEINPLVVLPDEAGALAVDALGVLNAG